MQPWAKKFISRFVLCGAAAYVTLLPQLYLLYETYNRYEFGWAAVPRTAVLIALALVGCAYGLAYAGLAIGAGWADRRKGRIPWMALVRGAAAWVLVVLILRAILLLAPLWSWLPQGGRQAVASPWFRDALYLALPAAWLLARRRKFAEDVRTAYRVPAVLFGLFLVLLFGWQTYTGDSGSPADLPGRAENGEKPNSLFVFMFDEWSYDETFGNPRFDLAQMPHLQDLLRQSVLHRNAYSPGFITQVSTLRFLYQPDPKIRAFSHPELLAMVENDAAPHEELNSIFALSDRHYGLVAGVYLHYARLLGRQVDCAIPFFDYVNRQPLRERVLNVLDAQVKFLQNIGIDRWDSAPLVDMSNAKLRGFQDGIRPLLGQILPRLPNRSIAFFHLFLPHYPFRYNRDWTLRTTSDGSEAELYLENVYALDAVIGDVVRMLRERGDFDSSLIVILSDHGKRDFRLLNTFTPHQRAQVDLDAYIPEKHVPLIVKYPQQSRGGDSDVRISTSELWPLFQSYLNEPDQVAEWVSRWNAGESIPPLYAAD